MILWIDPGIKKLGYAIIQKDRKVIEAGILTTQEKKFTREEQYHRMIEISNFFEEIFKKYPEIDKVCIEKYFFTAINIKNAEFIYWVRWILISQSLRKNMKVQEYTPIELKKRITGNGKAGKETVQKFIMKLFWLKELPEFHDSADALGLAYLGIK